MIIKHAVIDFVDPNGKKYYPSDPLLAEQGFLEIQCEIEGMSGEQILAAHVLVGEDSNEFQIDLYSLDAIPNSGRISDQEKLAFILDENKISEIRCFLFNRQSWRDYLALIRGKQSHATPSLTEKYNRARTKIHDCVAREVDSYLERKGLIGVQSRRFIALLRTYTLNRQEHISARKHEI